MRSRQRERLIPRQSERIIYTLTCPQSNNQYLASLPSPEHRDLTARLYIHDYGIDQVNAKLEGLVTLVSKLNTENPGLIDGIGAQGHLVVTVS